MKKIKVKIMKKNNKKVKLNNKLKNNKLNLLFIKLSLL